MKFENVGTTAADNLMAAVTAVIPNWKRDEETQKLLGGLDSVRTLVIQDGGRDKPIYGRAIAKNQGLSEVRTPYVWFLDTDVLPPAPAAIQTAVNLLEANSDIGAIGGQLVNGSCMVESLGLFYLGKCTPEAKGFSMRETECIATCNLLCRTKDALLIGGFDPLLEWGEDKDLCLSLQEMGKRLIILETFCVHHYFSPKGRMAKLNAIYRFYTDHFRLWRRH